LVNNLETDYLLIVNAKDLTGTDMDGALAYAIKCRTSVLNGRPVVGENLFNTRTLLTAPD